MTTVLDANRGQRLGSVIRLSGRVFGIALFVEEIVTERQPPVRKVWKTIGDPKLLVIGHYRMGFALSPRAEGSTLCVFIEYGLPEQTAFRWLGRLFAPHYARWCTQSMVDDAIKYFAASAGRARSDDGNQ